MSYFLQGLGLLVMWPLILAASWYFWGYANGLMPWLLGLVGLCVVASGLKLERDQRRVMQARELFASVEVLRSDELAPGGRLTLMSKHHLVEPAAIDRVEFNLLLLEAVERLTVTQRSAVRHLDELVAWSESAAVVLHGAVCGPGEVVATTGFTLPDLEEVQRQADQGFEERKRRPTGCRTTYAGRSLTWLVRVAIRRSDGLTYRTTFSLKGARPLWWFKGTEVCFSRR